MHRMHSDDGVELAQLMANVKAAGVITSLDMSLPDPFERRPRRLAGILAHASLCRHLCPIVRKRST